MTYYPLLEQALEAIDIALNKLNNLNGLEQFQSDEASWTSNLLDMQKEAQVLLQNIEAALEALEQEN